MKVNELFFELSNEIRYKIIKELSLKNMKHSDIVKKFKLPPPEVTRHVKRLLNTNLIYKTNDGVLSLTNYGKLINDTFDFYEFNNKFMQFINTHDIDAIPKELSLDFGTLKDCKISSQTMENIQLWSQIIKEAKLFIWAITDQFQTSIIPLIQQKLEKHKLEIKSILGTSLLNKLINTTDWEVHVKGMKPEVFLKLNKILGIPENIRKIDELKLSLTITDSKCVLFLSDSKGIDYSECLYAENNEKIITWAKGLFQYYWGKAQSISEKEIFPS